MVDMTDTPQRRTVHITGDGTTYGTRVEVEGVPLNKVRRVTFDLVAGDQPTVTIVLANATLDLRGIKTEDQA